MTSSFRQDEQGNVYQDTDGGATEGGTTTLLMGVTAEEGDGNGISRILTPLEMEEGVVNFEPTPPPEKLDEKQIK